MKAIQVKRTSRGFTLVELLLVITVIGIIAGLAIPAIGAAIRAANRAAMKAELNLIADGFENYKNKYGDYPPDFSSWSVAERHYRKAFPDIVDSELLLLFRLGDLQVDTDTTNQMQQAIVSTAWGSSIFYDNGGTPTPTGVSVLDRAEAVVWNLGGFSSDKQRPFTGTGGPLQLLPGASVGSTNPADYQYNPTRTNPLIDFEPERLTFQTFDPSSAVNVGNRIISTDEPDSSMGFPEPLFSFADVFPTYVFRENASPVVYFDSRTYNQFTDSGVVGIMNMYVRFIDGIDDPDVCRPMYSETPNSGPGTAYGDVLTASTAWQFMKPQSFQVLSPGLDRRYGALGDSDAGANGGLSNLSIPTNNFPVYYQYQSGRLVVLDTTQTSPNALFRGGVSRYDISGPFPDLDNAFGDNMGNFSEGELINSVP